MERSGPPRPTPIPSSPQPRPRPTSLAAIVRGRTQAVGRVTEQTVPSVPHLFYAELGVVMVTVLICVAPWP